MAGKPKKAFTELADVIGVEPPAEFNGLKADELEALTRMLTSSIELHEASIAEAEESVVKLAPRPLRGTVRKMLGVG